MTKEKVIEELRKSLYDSDADISGCEILLHNQAIYKAIGVIERFGLRERRDFITLSGEGINGNDFTMTIDVESINAVAKAGSRTSVYLSDCSHRCDVRESAEDILRTIGAREIEVRKEKKDD